MAVLLPKVTRPLRLAGKLSRTVLAVIQAVDLPLVHGMSDGTRENLKADSTLFLLLLVAPDMFIEGLGAPGGKWTPLTLIHFTVLV